MDISVTEIHNALVEAGFTVLTRGSRRGFSVHLDASARLVHVWHNTPGKGVAAAIEDDQYIVSYARALKGRGYKVHARPRKYTTISGRPYCVKHELYVTP